MSLELATEALRIVSTGSCQQEPMDLAVDQAELEASLKARFTTEAVVILWQRSRIIWGRCQDECLKIAGDLSLDLNQTLELRVFNEEEELHLKRQEKFRLRFLTKQELLQKASQRLQMLFRLEFLKMNFCSMLIPLKQRVNIRLPRQ